MSVEVSDMPAPLFLLCLLLATAYDRLPSWEDFWSELHFPKLISSSSLGLHSYCPSAGTETC